MMEDSSLLEEIDMFFAFPAMSPACASMDSEVMTNPSETDCGSHGESFGSPMMCESPAGLKGFTQEEDDLLRHLAAELSFDWPRIARLLPNKTPSQVARRWTCKLDPSIKKAKWSSLEDREIERLQLLYGNNWKLIAQFLPGRPPATVKSRFYNSIRKKSDVKTPPPRSITQMQFPMPGPHPQLQDLGQKKEVRIVMLRKQLAGMEMLMNQTKAELARLEKNKNTEACDRN